MLQIDLNNFTEVFKLFLYILVEYLLKCFCNDHLLLFWQDSQIHVQSRHKKRSSCIFLTADTEKGDQVFKFLYLEGKKPSTGQFP